VFSGGWTLEAAEAVCANRDIEPHHVLDLLAELVDKSLVQVERQAGEARHRLLETIRQYARERLVEAGQVQEVRSRHRDWYLALVERAEPGLTWGNPIARPRPSASRRPASPD
jgi:non-specific serine/threonine protein kinase